MALSVICGLNVYLLILRASNFKAVFDSLCTYPSLDHPIPDQFLTHFALPLPWTIQFTSILLTLHVFSPTMVIHIRNFRVLLTNLLIYRSFLTWISVGRSHAFPPTGHSQTAVSKLNNAYFFIRQVYPEFVFTCSVISFSQVIHILPIRAARLSLLHESPHSFTKLFYNRQFFYPS